MPQTVLSPQKMPQKVQPSSSSCNKPQPPAPDAQQRTPEVDNGADASGLAAGIQALKVGDGGTTWQRPRKSWLTDEVNNELTKNKHQFKHV